MRFVWLTLCILALAGLPVLAAPQVADVRLDSGEAVGGTRLQGKVVLTEPAPQQGVWVELYATGPANAPRAVHVPPGQRSVDFLLDTDPVAEATPVQVHALLHGLSSSRLLMLESTPEGFAAAP